MAKIKDNWPLIISWVVCGGLLFYAFGCEPQTQSLIDPERKVTAAELEYEIDFLMTQHTSRLDDLQKQQEIRNFVLQQGLIFAEGGVVNPVGIITSILAILGIGAAGDDLRLRHQRKIIAQKNEPTN